MDDMLASWWEAVVVVLGGVDEGGEE